MTAKTMYAGAAGLALVLAGLAFFLPGAVGDRTRSVSMTVLSPVWASFDWIQGKAVSVRDGAKGLTQLQTEVEELRQHNALLTVENTRLNGIEKENNRLKEMLGFSEASSYRLLACRVVERDTSNWWNTIIINRGWKNSQGWGLEQDQPVVSARGVVGKTGTVGEYTTRVILLVDENCKISAVTEDSRARGIVVGNSPLNGGTPNCVISFVDRTAPFSVGERVLTTGLGGTFPANLLIGTVSSAPDLTTDKNFGLYREGTVEPSVDLNNLEELFVITGVKQP